jgi:hypothetical protein
MYIVAIAWGYVVLMMSITEDSVVAGLMTLALYGILPLTIVLYIMGTGGRKRRRAAAEAATVRARSDAATTSAVIAPVASQEGAAPPPHQDRPESQPDALQKQAP